MRRQLVTNDGRDVVDADVVDLVSYDYEVADHEHDPRGWTVVDRDGATLVDPCGDRLLEPGAEIGRGGEGVARLAAEPLDEQLGGAASVAIHQPEGRERRMLVGVAVMQTVEGAGDAADHAVAGGRVE